MSKRPRTLDAFFSPPPTKKSRLEGVDSNAESADAQSDATVKTSTHPTYPFAIPHLPPHITESLNFAPAEEGRIINDQPDLDLLYFQPYIPKDIQRGLFEFLRSELFFYRVQYNIKRGPVETQINTPRYTTVFGLDETSKFNDTGNIIDATTGKPPTGKDTYACKPRPIPDCLDILRRLTENTTGCKFNFALVNYYASGNDSISYHSDDERFLGPEPAIASFTLGAKRDFLLRHKKTPNGHPSESKPMKLPLASGDMVLMRGRTQGYWEHSIPKRKGGEADKGRINITFRRAMVKGGTANYYRYNVGDGGVFKWDERKREMVPWTK
jgi:alkylated DNA repair dioxygenase AlkB